MIQPSGGYVMTSQTRPRARKRESNETRKVLSIKFSDGRTGAHIIRRRGLVGAYNEYDQIYSDDPRLPYLAAEGWEPD
jgi:hypothetical protein